MADQYTYSDSEVLKNKAGITDTLYLHAFERKYVTARQAELAEQPIKGNFDMEHLKKIHGYLFQDVYAWAGKVRDIDIARIDPVNNKTFEFCQSHLLDGYQENIFSKLKKDDYLQKLDQDTFAAKAAEAMGEINMLHPFREGNGRTQREFIRELGLQAGWEIDFSGITKEQMTEASIASFNMDYSGLKDLIRNNIRPLGLEQEPEYKLRIKEIQEAPEVNDLSRSAKAKEIFCAYAKPILTAAVIWNAKQDELVVTAMLKAGLEKRKIEKALAFSPSTIKKNNIEKTIYSKSLLKKFAKKIKSKGNEKLLGR